MQFVDNNNINDPRVNLAIEEHLLRNWDTAESILLFYINEPAVIIGRNQNTLEEIDPDFVREKGIHGREDETSSGTERPHRSMNRFSDLFGVTLS